MECERDLIGDAIGEDGERELRRAASAITVFEPGRAMIVEVETERQVIGFAAGLHERTHDFRFRIAADRIDFFVCPRGNRRLIAGTTATARRRSRLATRAPRACACRHDTRPAAPGDWRRESAF